MRKAKEMDKRKSAGSSYIDMLCSSKELNQSSVRWGENEHLVGHCQAP